MKRKYIIILFSLLILVGCSKIIDENKMIYDGYVTELKELKEVADSDSYKDLIDIDVKLTKNSDDEITYSVVIDNPKVKMKKVEVLIYHDKKTEDVYPSIGIFDEKKNLIPGLKKNTDTDVKGMVFVGYIKTKQEVEEINLTIKGMIAYNDENNERQKIYFIKKYS